MNYLYLHLVRACACRCYIHRRREIACAVEHCPERTIRCGRKIARKHSAPIEHVLRISVHSRDSACFVSKRYNGQANRKSAVHGAEFVVVVVYACAYHVRAACKHASEVVCREFNSANKHEQSYVEFVACEHVRFVAQRRVECCPTCRIGQVCVLHRYGYGALGYSVHGIRCTRVYERYVVVCVVCLRCGDCVRSDVSALRSRDRNERLCVFAFRHSAFSDADDECRIRISVHARCVKHAKRYFSLGYRVRCFRCVHVIVCVVVSKLDSVRACVLCVAY